MLSEFLIHPHTLWLPKEIVGATWDDLEKIGIAQTGKASTDLMECTFPAGWRLTEADQTMRVHVLDSRGHKRGRIVPGPDASWYESGWTLRWLRKYGWDMGPDAALPLDISDQHLCRWRIADSDGNTVYQSSGSPYAQVAADAVFWLDKHLPLWRNVLAYWEDEL